MSATIGVVATGTPPARALGDLAHARAGDKGDTSIIVVVCDREADYPHVRRTLEPTAVAVHFGVPGASVTVRPTPALCAVTLVVRGRLDGGVTRSRSADPHGKTLSGHVLAMAIAPIEDEGERS